MTHAHLRGLYVISDANLIAESTFSQTIECALLGGAKIIQYRDKSNNTEKRRRQTQEIKLLCETYDAVFIINDDIELAKEVNANGVHLGSNDADYATARTILGDNKIIGISCYNQFELAQQAQQQGADYIALGRFFSSSTKPNAAAAPIELLTHAKQKLNIPVCAIGGITVNNSAELIAAGVDMLAVINAVFSSNEVQSTCQKFSSFFEGKSL